MNLQPPAPHIKRHILETLYNSGAPKVCTLSDFGQSKAFEVFNALSYMAEHGWVEKIFHGRFFFQLTDYGVHVVELGLVIENAGAVDDDPGDVSTHFHRLADSAREASAIPPVRQASPIGNGARQGKSSAGRALDFVGRASSESTTGNGVPVSALASEGARAPKYGGLLLPSLIALVEDKLAKYYTPCPQGDDCIGDGQHRRLYDCVHGCGFRGCVPCIAQHEAEPHWGDSDTAREMHSGLRVIDGGQR